jgi:hypothetical protein
MPASRFAAWAGAPAGTGVAGVIRVTDRPDPSTSAGLDAAVGVTRAAKRNVTGVTAPRLSAMEVTQVTPSTPQGLPRKPIADKSSYPGNLSNPQKEQRTTSVYAAASPVWWRALFEQRAVLHELNGKGPREQAGGLAFNDLILEWHRRYGVRPDPQRCAGCGDELGDEAGLVLCDDARVHLDGIRGANCLISYGKKWRSAAIAALEALGLDPPEGFTLL